MTLPALRFVYMFFWARFSFIGNSKTGSIATSIVERKSTLQKAKTIEDIYPNIVSGVKSPNPTDTKEMIVNQTELNIGSKDISS